MLHRVQSMGHDIRRRDSLGIIYSIFLCISFRFWFSLFGILPSMSLEKIYEEYDGHTRGKRGHYNGYLRVNQNNTIYCVCGCFNNEVISSHKKRMDVLNLRSYSYLIIGGITVPLFEVVTIVTVAF
jgi:hypothetical protein